MRTGPVPAQAAKTKERDTAVLSNAAIELRS
jgi:hypothetical protein